MESEGIIVGIYGIQGVGKSYVLKQIAAERIEWRVVDGSQLIRELLVERGQSMEYFEKEMNELDKAAVRQAAIRRVKEKPGITLIAGHCSFPIIEEGSVDHGSKSIVFENVFTKADGTAYDGIFYIEKDASQVFEQIENDTTRARSKLSVGGLQEWMEHEKAMLEAKCKDHDILFRVVSSCGKNDYRDLISLIVETMVVPACEQARLKSEQALVSTIEVNVPDADVYLLIDGDGTLCPQDTGTLFFQQVSTLEVSQPLKMIFKRYGKYTFQAFWEVAMLYSKVWAKDEYISLCHNIGSEQVHVHEAWKTFLNGLPSNVHPIIVSSSIREVWLEMQSVHTGFGRMTIIAGNNLMMHKYIVDDSAKALVALTLRKLHGGCRIISFGDSALDVLMFCESDQAYVAVDDKMNRSMKDFIAQNKCLGPSHFRLSQLVDLGPGASRKYHTGLPVQTLGSLLKDLCTGSINDLMDCASGSISAQILATTMRDASINGPGLQRAHEEAGAFLADRVIDCVGKKMGLVERVEFSHVKGGTSAGLRISPSNTVILPLMRGGEPMARGVYSRFPSSHFIHFYDSNSVGVSGDSRNELLAKALQHLDSSRPVNMFVVDSVINTGSSIKNAINSISQMVSKVESKFELTVYVLSGVMQEDAADQLPPMFPRVRFVTLRVSTNKYTGRGTSDTGNRLFGTTFDY